MCFWKNEELAQRHQPSFLTELQNWKNFDMTPSLEECGGPAHAKKALSATHILQQSAHAP